MLKWSTFVVEILRLHTHMNPTILQRKFLILRTKIYTRTNSISDMEEYGVEKEHDYNFNPVFVICDEIILMKLVFPDKLYKETIAQINSIIVSGRSKKYICRIKFHNLD